ncbi:MAG: YlmC/YmxH family sporulation protein [Lachnospiraceae bacterium]|nr:YlmC/YmxH family sporulation protein [Lachnospiraceae bacterium]
MLFSELRQKEVISIKECRKLGHVSDIEFDCHKGCIEKIHVPGRAKFCNLFNQEPDYVICFCDIKQIGPDIILVDI